MWQIEQEIRCYSVHHSLELITWQRINILLQSGKLYLKLNARDVYFGFDCTQLMLTIWIHWAPYESCQQQGIIKEEVEESEPNRFVYYCHFVLWPTAFKPAYNIPKAAILWPLLEILMRENRADLILCYWHNV